MSAPDARSTDMATSHQAAADNRPRRPTQRTRALQAFAAELLNHGLTDFELADRLNIQQTSAGKRRLELQRLGFVRHVRNTDCDGCLTREAPSGSLATVWQITSAGLDHWRSGEPVPLPPEGPTRERVAEITVGDEMWLGRVADAASMLAHRGRTVRLVVEVER